MKFTKLFLMAVLMVLAFDATSVQNPPSAPIRSNSWIRSTNNTDSYDNLGYKGASAGIFVGVECGSHFEPLRVKLVGSYEGLMDEIKKTISHSQAVQHCLQTHNLEINNLKLWDRD